MENDEKRKKVIDELERRKKIVENYLGSNSSSEDLYRYACYKAYCRLIDNALDFVKEDTIKYNKCDYSTYESYYKSISKRCEKRPFLILYRIAIGDFNSAISYIGIVIDDINDNFYPADSYKILGEINL